MKTEAQQLYPPEPTVTFPAHSELAEQLYPQEPPLTFPPDPQNVNTRGLRAEAQALTREDLASLSVGHATATQRVDPSQLYVSIGLLMVIVVVLVLAVVRRKENRNNSKRDDAPPSRHVTFADSYEPFLGSSKMEREGQQFC